jgi:glutamate synthase (NADPH/NADH) small chain
VWAITASRTAAAAVNRYLGGGTMLPAPIAPTARLLT